MIIDILIWIAFHYFACGLLTGRFPHELLPPVKRRQIAAERRREERRMLDRIEREEEQARRDALRALRVDDVAFLAAGGHWTPPMEVTERLRQEAFLREEEAREIERQKKRELALKLRAEYEAEKAQRLALPAPERRAINEKRSKEAGNLTAAEVARRHSEKVKAEMSAKIALFESLGIPFEAIHVAEKLKPVAVIATGSTRITSEGMFRDGGPIYNSPPFSPRAKIDSQRVMTSKAGMKYVETTMSDGTVFRHRV